MKPPLYQMRTLLNPADLILRMLQSKVMRLSQKMNLSLPLKTRPHHSPCQLTQIFTLYQRMRDY